MLSSEYDIIIIVRLLNDNTFENGQTRINFQRNSAVELENASTSYVIVGLHVIRFLARYTNKGETLIYHAVYCYANNKQRIKM